MEPVPALPEAAPPPPPAEASGSKAEPAVVQPDQGVEEMTLTVKWSGKEYTVRVCGDDSVAELKRRICEVTTVLPKRQKLLYPKMAAKLGDDSLLLSSLTLKPSVKMTMIGSVFKTLTLVLSSLQSVLFLSFSFSPKDELTL